MSRGAWVAATRRLCSPQSRPPKDHKPLHDEQVCRNKRSTLHQTNHNRFGAYFDRLPPTGLGTLRRRKRSYMISLCWLLLAVAGARRKLLRPTPVRRGETGGKASARCQTKRHLSAIQPCGTRIRTDSADARQILIAYYRACSGSVVLHASARAHSFCSAYFRLWLSGV